MKTIRFLGPMPERSYKRDGRTVTHKKGETYSEPDDFADECLGMNPEGYTLEEAAARGIPVYELPKAAPPPRLKADD